MNFDEDFSVIVPGCGCPRFAVPTSTYSNWRKTHKSWHCPHCGSQRHFTGPTEEQKKIAELERGLQWAQERANREAAEHRELHRQNKRIIKRIKNGVCPCCTRTFGNLARHMATEHPDFGNDKSLRALREAYGLSQSALARQIDVQPAYISNFENGKYIPEYAKQKVEAWLAQGNEG